MTDRPNVLLVVLDSVRAKNCGLYGHENETTPFLKSITDKVTVFEQAKSPSIHSISSHASIFSGYHTEEHNVTEHESHLKPEANIWNKLGAEYDYETGMFTPNVVITRSSNLSESFHTCVGPKRDTSRKVFEGGTSPAHIEGNPSPIEYLTKALHHDKPLRSIINGMYFTTLYGSYRDLFRPILTRIGFDYLYGSSHDSSRESADVYVDEFLNWVGNRTGPWAACINLMDAHFPYVPKDEYDLWGGKPLAHVQESIPNGPMTEEFLQGRPWGQLQALEALYDGCIRQLDAELEGLFSELERRGQLDNTLLVITSDHGEGFGEQSTVTPAVRLVDHSWGIDEVLTHVPLIIKEPGQSSGKRIQELATLTKFPDVVKAGIEGGETVNEFVPTNEPVISSTYRIKQPGDELPLNEADREHYFGPWRAIYREEEGQILKYVKRRDDTVTMRIRDAQISYPIRDTVNGLINDYFEGLSDAGVKASGTKVDPISEDIERQLADLGYLR